MIRQNYYELKSKYPLDNLINKTRIGNTTAMELRKIHYEFGKLLGLEILGSRPKINKQAITSQGNKESLTFFDDRDFVVVGILRAGLYLSEGIREIFPSCEYILCKNAERLSHYTQKNIILVDAVINTGETIINFLDSIHKNNRIYIATNVIYNETIDKLLNISQSIDIFSIRKSQNTYVGKGANDTGNRIFNSQDDKI